MTNRADRTRVAGRTRARRGAGVAAALVLALPLVTMSATGAAARDGLPPSSFAARGAAAARQADPAEVMFVHGFDLERQGSLRQAVEEYAQLVANYPDSDRADDALIRLVEVHRMLGETDAALQRADELVERFPNAQGAAAGQVLRAEMEMERARSSADLSAVSDVFGRVTRMFLPDIYPDLEWRARARVRSGQTKFLLGELDEAAGAFLLTVEDEAVTRWTDEARLGLANVLLWQGDWMSATEILQRIVSEVPEEAVLPTDAPAMVARRRLELVYRLHLAPSVGRPSWSSTRQLSVGRAIQDPIGVAAADDGSLIVVLDDGDRAFVVEAGGQALPPLTASDPRLPLWADGVPYWVVKGGIVPLDGRRRLNFLEERRGESEPRQLENLRAAAPGRYGKWFVVDEAEGKRVLAFEASLRHSGSLVDRADESEAYDIDHDARGQLYVLDRRGKRVMRFGADGQHLGNAASGDWDEPEALAVDALGNVYVLDRGAERIHVYGPRAQLIETLGPPLPGGPALSSPRDIAVDGSGRIYVADRDLDAILVIE